MTEQGSGGYTMAYCHQCQKLVMRDFCLSDSLIGFIHIDGTPLCKEVSHD